VVELAKGNERRHVVASPKGGWDVKKPGSSRVSVHADTQQEAVARARDIVRNQGGGEVRIHGRDGKIRDSDTIAPGNDPHPPRDKR
jgi:beta-galactosidase GanA